MKLTAEEGYLYIHKTDRTSKGSVVYCPDGAENDFEMLPEEEANALYEAALLAQYEESHTDEDASEEDYADALRELGVEI